MYAILRVGNEGGLSYGSILGKIQEYDINCHCYFHISFSTCSWNEGRMAAYNCSIDSLMFRSFGTFVNNFLFMSIFTLGIPLLIYLWLVVQLIKVIQEAHKKNRISYLFLITTISFLISLCFSTYMNETDENQFFFPIQFLILIVALIFRFSLDVSALILILRPFILWIKRKISHKQETE